jgi:hypothetical protein
MIAIKWGYKEAGTKIGDTLDGTIIKISKHKFITLLTEDGLTYYFGNLDIKNKVLKRDLGKHMKITYNGRYVRLNGKTGRHLFIIYIDGQHRPSPWGPWK